MTFALDFLGLLHKRRQKWDKKDNLRQNTACSEQKYTLLLKCYIPPLEVMAVIFRRSKSPSRHLSENLGLGIRF